jgi:hypothetical protein
MAIPRRIGSTPELVAVLRPALARLDGDANVRGSVVPRVDALLKQLPPNIALTSKALSALSDDEAAYAVLSQWRRSHDHAFVALEGSESFATVLEAALELAKGQRFEIFPSWLSSTTAAARLGSSRQRFLTFTSHSRRVWDATDKLVTEDVATFVKNVRFINAFVERGHELSISFVMKDSPPYVPSRSLSFTERSAFEWMTSKPSHQNESSRIDDLPRDLLQLIHDWRRAAGSGARTQRFLSMIARALQPPVTDEAISSILAQWGREHGTVGPLSGPTLSELARSIRP